MVVYFHSREVFNVSTVEIKFLSIPTSSARLRKKISACT